MAGKQDGIAGKTPAGYHKRTKAKTIWCDRLVQSIAGSPMPRVRHHTDDAGLEGIRQSGAINPARGWGRFATGIHVEVEPFGTLRPGRGGPKDEMGAAGQGAFVEFDAPSGMVGYTCGPRNTALIPSDSPLFLDDLNPVYRKVRKWWWQLWREKVD